MDALHIIAGLGNPGPEYADTRHNAGFMVVEKFGERHRARWSGEGKFRSRIARVEVGGVKVILCEPQDYMNNSGEAVGGLAAYYKVPPERILAIVDDADLPFGQIRLRVEGSSGGHHGLESVEKHLDSRNFARLRIGIGRTDRQVREISGHVLGKFGAEEKKLLETILETAARQIETIYLSGIQKAMSQFNGAVIAPAKKETK